jgi:hypothetical protein
VGADASAHGPRPQLARAPLDADGPVRKNMTLAILQKKEKKKERGAGRATGKGRGRR